MEKRLVAADVCLMKRLCRTKRKGSLGTREMLIVDSPYRAIIQVDEDKKKVFILRILHTSRNI